MKHPGDSPETCGPQPPPRRQTPSGAGAAGWCHCPRWPCPHCTRTGDVGGEKAHEQQGTTSMHGPACHHPASVTHAFSSVATIHFIFSELANQKLLHPVFSLQIKKLRPEKGSDITKINSLIQDSSLTQQWLDLFKDHHPGYFC